MLALTDRMYLEVVRFGHRFQGVPLMTGLSAAFLATGLP
jgi:hypothetical protein